MENLSQCYFKHIQFCRSCRRSHRRRCFSCGEKWKRSTESLWRKLISIFDRLAAWVWVVYKFTQHFQSEKNVLWRRGLELPSTTDLNCMSITDNYTNLPKVHRCFNIWLHLVRSTDRLHIVEAEGKAIDARTYRQNKSTFCAVCRIAIRAFIWPAKWNELRRWHHHAISINWMDSLCLYFA